MKALSKTLPVFLLPLLLFNNSASSQIKEPSYTLTLLKAKYIDSTNPKEIILVFKHSSKSGQIEKLIISGRLTYSFDNNTSKTDILGKGPNQHTITIFGNDVEEKNKYIFDLIKKSPDFSIADNVRFIVFTLKNLTDKFVDKMSFTYGLWEPLDENTRIETKYEITIDK